MRWGAGVGRCKEDERHARSADAPLRHHRDRQHELAVQEPFLIPNSEANCAAPCRCRDAVARRGPLRTRAAAGAPPVGLRPPYVAPAAAHSHQIAARFPPQILAPRGGHYWTRKGVTIGSDLTPLCSSNVLSATQRTRTSGKNYWAILRGTRIPESIRAIGDSYSLLGAFAEHDQRVVARVGALLLDEQPSDSSDQQLCLLYLRYRTAATFLSLPEMHHETGKPLHIKGLLGILIPPFPGSNLGAPASQCGLCGVISRGGRTADIPEG